MSIGISLAAGLAIAPKRSLRLSLGLPVRHLSSSSQSKAAKAASETTAQESQNALERANQGV